VRRASEKLSPFRQEGLLRRTAPFLVAMVVAFAAIRLPAAGRDSSEILAAAALNIGLIVLVVVLPWNLRAELTEQLAYIKEWGGRLVFPIPSLDVV